MDKKTYNGIRNKTITKRQVLIDESAEEPAQVSRNRKSRRRWPSKVGDDDLPTAALQNRRDGTTDPRHPRRCPRPPRRPLEMPPGPGEGAK